MGLATMPPMAASAAPSAKMQPNSSGTLMPMPAAVAASSTPALTMAPTRLRSRNHHSSAATSPPKAMMKSRYLGTIAPAISSTPSRLEGTATLRMSVPQIMWVRSENT